MRHIRLLFCVASAMLLIGVNPTFAQVGWTTMNTGSTRDMEGVFSVTALQTIAVGASGTIIGTTNGGANWISAPSGSSERLRKVIVAGFTTPVVWVVGDAGTLLKSTSGGYTWSSSASGTSANLHDIWAMDYANATSLCAVGASGTILVTTNSGTTWNPKTSPSSSNLNGVFFTDVLLGYIVGDGGLILLTTDGGNSWSSVSSGVSSDLNHVFFTSLQNGWIAGDNGVILSTTDGGQSWSTVSSGVTEDLRRLFFADAQTGVAVGRAGTILRTTNTGASWTKQVSGTNLDLNSVFFTDALTGIVVGDDGLAKKTTNGGVPVELERFSATALADGTIRLTWTTVAETQNYGFHVERMNEDGWNTVGFVSGNGDTHERRSYTFTDNPMVKGSVLRYRLRQVDFDGTWEYSPEVFVHTAVPAQLALSVSPNPSSAAVVLRAELTSEIHTSLSVYDATGKRIALVFEGLARSGSHLWRWAPANVAPGIYYAILRAGGIVRSTPVIFQ